MKYKLQKDLHYKTDITGMSYQRGYLRLSKNGDAVVKAGAVSDGCSPKWRIPGIGMYGIPDGPLDKKTGMPVTARAFYLHDALLEHRDNFPYLVTSREIHDEFCKEIWQTQFFLKSIYCFFVRLFGPRW